MKAKVRGSNNNNTTVLPSIPLQSCTGCHVSSLDAASLEKLLIQCANALDRNNITLAQQLMWVLNNVASPTGDLNQRLASHFLRALVSKASTLCPVTPMKFDAAGSGGRRSVLSVTELAGYVDLIPWHRFGFCASNGAILRAIRGFSKVHVLDFSITYGMQWPTLIDALGKRPEGPPAVRVSVLSWRPPVPPLLGVTVEEIGQRLSNFARYREVPFEFSVVDVGTTSRASSLSEAQWELLLGRLSPSMFKLKGDEALVVNFQNWMRYLSNEIAIDSSDMITSCRRDSFLEVVKTLNPRIVTVIDEDCDLGASSGVASRIASCFNYMWIPFDALETFLPKDNSQRMQYESDIGQKIENIVAYEYRQRIERPELGAKLCQRMGNKGFASVAFDEETVKEVKALLGEHSSGWGLKQEEDMFVLTWKGHNSVYASVWALRDPGFE